MPAFLKASRELVNLGDSVEDRVVSIQTLGCGKALNELAELIKRHNSKPVYIANFTWPCHSVIFENAGLKIKKYGYYDFMNCKIDF